MSSTMDSLKTLPSSSKLWNTFAVLAMLNALDAATTAILVQMFGPMIEANPIVRYWILQYGVMGLYMFKFVAVGFLGLVIAFVVRYYREHRAMLTAYRCTVFVCIIMTFIVVNNTILVALAINT